MKKYILQIKTVVFCVIAGTTVFYCQIEQIWEKYAQKEFANTLKFRMNAQNKFLPKIFLKFS